jgi:hypothetical protein
MASAPTRQDESQDLDVEKAESPLLSFAAFSELPKSALFCRVFTFLALTVARLRLNTCSTPESSETGS